MNKWRVGSCSQQGMGSGSPKTARLLPLTSPPLPACFLIMDSRERNGPHQNPGSCLIGQCCGATGSRERIHNKPHGPCPPRRRVWTLI